MTKDARRFPHNLNLGGSSERTDRMGFKPRVWGTVKAITTNKQASHVRVSTILTSQITSFSLKMLRHGDEHNREGLMKLVTYEVFLLFSPSTPLISDSFERGRQSQVRSKVFPTFMSADLGDYRIRLHRLDLWPSTSACEPGKCSSIHQLH